MHIPDQGVLLRIFIGESDTHEGRPLYEAILLKAKELKLAGCTVLRGLMGFGAHSRIHSAKVLRISRDLPIVVEIVDSEEKVNTIMPYLDEAVREGLVTIEKVKVIKYRNRHSDG